MINYIWGFLMISSIICAVFTGKLPETVDAAFSGANSSVTTIMGFLGAMCMWTGLVKIAQKSGIINLFSRAVYPITKIIFPSLKKDSEQMKAISMNVVANILGLANAATPLGIKAMQSLNETNSKKHIATKEMCMLVVLNTASIQLIPSTLIALRSSMGSKNPAEIILPIWISSFLTALIAVLCTKICQRRHKN